MDDFKTSSVPREGSARVTAAMVGARAGVSVATVSLVTSGKTAGRVSKENIARVQEAVAELGYVVNGLGSSLAKGRSNIVILVAPDVSNPFFAKVIAGVREVLGESFQLLLSVTEAGQTPAPQDVRKLLALRPAGLLVDAPSAHFLAELQMSDPMVLLDAAGITSAAPSINFDVPTAPTCWHSTWKRKGTLRWLILTAQQVRRRSVCAARPSTVPQPSSDSKWWPKAVP